MKARFVWLASHRWLGIVLGPLLVLIGLTGSLLVFDHAIDEWLHPELLLVQHEGPSAPIDDLIASAERAFNHGPGSKAPAKAISLSSPRVPDGVWTAWFSDGDVDHPEFTAVYLEPSTARVTGQRTWGYDPMSFIYRLHFRLLSGDIGAMIVGSIGLLMLVSVASGLVVWWPLWKHSLRSALAIRRGRRFTYDLHKTVGVLSMGVLAVVAATGVTMEFPKPFNALLNLVSTRTEEPVDLRSDVGSLSHRLSPEEAIAIARRHYPDARFCHFHPPADEQGVYEVAVHQDNEVQRSYGRTQLFINQYTGRILAKRLPENDTLADTIAVWQFPLHNGEAFGLLGRWVLFFSGMTPAILYTSGMLVWIRKRKATRGRHERLPSQSRLGTDLVSRPANRQETMITG